jgi:hypothetical protein
LAISTAGGSDGVLAFPLVVDAGDLAVLNDNVKDRLAHGSPEDMRRILDAIAGAVSVIGGTSFGGIAPGILALAEAALEACRNRWDSERTEVPIANLSEYYELSLKISPLPRGPNLLPTWDASCAQFADIEGANHLTVWRLIGTLAWLKLALLILENEPRFLRQVGFPEKWKAGVERFLTTLEQHVEAIELDIGDFDELNDYMEQLDTEIDLLYRFKEPLSNLVIAMPYFSGKAKELLATANLRRARLESDRDENVPEPDLIDSGDVQAVREFDVNSIFVDL